MSNLKHLNSIDQKWLKRLDLTLIGAVLCILILSLVIIGSATHINAPSGQRFLFVERQGLFALIDICLAAFLMNFDYRSLRAYGQPLYIINLVVLLAVMFFGFSALGAQRWLQLGSLQVQPSEFAKLIMIVSLASLLEGHVGKLNTLKDLAPLALYVGVPFFLVLKQPDLGTSLVFIAIFLAMIFASGVNLKLLGGIFAVGLASLPVLWFFLKGYQKMRILVFLNPNVDPLGAGYHIIQSKIAIGSGLLTGKGLFAGTQSQLNFLPEKHTDFIFSVLGEELGFIGGVILLLLYLVILWRGIQIARQASDTFGMLLAVGITAMIAFHVLVNVGMTIGIMPVTGIPLPLMSYGVSSLTTNLMAITLLLNIHIKGQNLLF